MANDIQSELSQWGEVVPAGKLTVKEALEVYRDGYHARLVDSLRETYSAVNFFLGDEKFTELALDFTKNNSSSFYNLNHYGQGFAKTLPLPFLAELAHFEWEFCRLFHAKLDKSQMLKEIPNHDFKLTFVSHLRIFQYKYGIVNLWNAYANSSDDSPDWQTPQNLILYRQGSDLRIKELSNSEYALLHLLMQAKTMATGFAVDLDEEAVSALFSFLAAEGLILSIGT
jgi:hypothetical protein